MPPNPKVSVIVIAYRMASQLQNTLLTLAPGYQRGVSAEDYEVIVLENDSGENLPTEQVEALRLPEPMYLYLTIDDTPSVGMTETLDALLV